PASGDVKALHGEPQAVLEPDEGLPAEQLTRGAHVRPGVADVTRPRRSVLLANLRAENLPDRLRDAVHAGGRAGPAVWDPPAAVARLGRAQRCIDDVVDVGEVAPLLSVAEPGYGLAPCHRRDEQRHHRRVLGEGALARTEDVEVAQHHGLERVVDAREADAV